MQVGYVRVSTAEQNTARQEVLMCELDVVFGTYTVTAH